MEENHNVDQKRLLLGPAPTLAFTGPTPHLPTAPRFPFWTFLWGHYDRYGGLGHELSSPQTARGVCHVVLRLQQGLFL